MSIKTLEPIQSVATQTLPGQLAHLAKSGLEAIICDRPDGEGSDPASCAEMKAAATAAEKHAAYLPIMSGKDGDAEAVAFGTALGSLPNPILAHCRIGTRLATLWSLSEGGCGWLLPSFRNLLIASTRPSHLAWLLTEQMLSPIHCKTILRGREGMAKPQCVTAA